MELDKWQQRAAEEYARDNGVTEAEAVAELGLEAPAEVPAAEVTNPAEVDPVTLTK